MKGKRIHNFNAGPATLPEKVLKKVQQSFLNLEDSGMSIVEISHRSKLFDKIINDAISRAKRLLNIGDEFEILFVQGGASMQFLMIPKNFLNDKNNADYVDTGTWSSKAIAEAKFQNKNINVVASSKDKDYSYIPYDISFNKDAAFVHITSNNTIKGTQWHKFPTTSGVPIFADMSSDIMSRPLDMNKFGLIYAGAQKNIGPAGVAMVIVRKDILKQANTNVSPMLSYLNYQAKQSMYNTPSCFSIYVISLVLEWLEEEFSNLEKIDAFNQKKAKVIYDILDAKNLYMPTAQKDSRSLMNITFRIEDEKLEKNFLEESQKEGFVGLKGHRSVGGFRASCYNACPMSSVEALASFMEKFAKNNK